MVVRRHPETGERHLDLLNWGLLPCWAKDPARAEIVASPAGSGGRERLAATSCGRREAALCRPPSAGMDDRLRSPDHGLVSTTLLPRRLQPIYQQYHGGAGGLPLPRCRDGGDSVRHAFDQDTHQPIRINLGRDGAFDSVGQRRDQVRLPSSGPAREESKAGNLGRVHVGTIRASVVLSRIIPADSACRRC